LGPHILAGINIKNMGSVKNIKINVIAILLILLFCEKTSAQKEKINEPFFILQLTDPQFGMFEKNIDFKKETLLYEKTVIGVNQLNPEFVVITGDFVHDQNSELQMNEFKRITAEINPDIPVYYTPGNHDIGLNPTNKTIKEYRKNYGKDRFSFIYNDCLFIGFNSGLIKADLPKAEKRQYKWLIRQLKKGRNAKQIILFCHYPFFIKSVDEPEDYTNIGIKDRKRYLTLFKEYKVDAIFSGHYHNNAINSYYDIELVTTSAVGKPLGKAPSGLRIIIIENNKISHKYIGLEELPYKFQLD
jgi:serine/threonine-protein phosphatase CPPED1